MVASLSAMQAFCKEIGWRGFVYMSSNSWVSSILKNAFTRQSHLELNGTDADADETLKPLTDSMVMLPSIKVFM